MNGAEFLRRWQPLSQYIQHTSEDHMIFLSIKRGCRFARFPSHQVSSNTALVIDEAHEFISRNAVF